MAQLGNGNLINFYMTKVIQMVKTSEDNNLWIIGYNDETKE